jgi:pimeloyl-ACP methyl ester carboxylesterase
MTTKFLEHQNGKIAYDEDGAGPLVLCVPSMGDLRQEYRFLAPQLVSSGYRTVRMDVRGHGETSTSWPGFSVSAVGSDMLALIDHLQAGPASIIGASMAAGAAVWAAAEGHERIKSLVLIGPFVRGESTWQNRLMYGALFSRPWGPAVWGKYYSSLYPTQKPADFTQYSSALVTNLRQAGRLESLKQMIMASKSESERRLPEVRAPALVLMGSKDPDFKEPETEARWVADALDARLEMIPGAGHYPHAEMPEATGPVILRFLEETTR